MPTTTGVADRQTTASLHVISDVSDNLVRARSMATPLSSFPGLTPRDTQTAYAIQTNSIVNWPDEVGGWKVGGITPAFREHFAAERLAGPIFKSQIVQISDGHDVTMTVFDGGFAAIEAEFIIKTARPVGPKTFDTRNLHLEDLVASIHAGAEIASSPLSTINDIGPGAIISDFGNNAGLVIGPEISRWQERSSDPVDITVEVDGKIVGSITRSIGDDALAAFGFLFDLTLSRGLTMPAGTYVTCGALSGIHDVAPGAESNVVFGGLAEFSVSFARRYPTT
jgi:2-keto-4-pentenoate hydratase